jgi:hypothetical protein
MYLGLDHRERALKCRSVHGLLDGCSVLDDIIGCGLVDFGLFLYRLLGIVARNHAAFEVEELGEVGGLFLAARPALVSVVENWHTRVKGARLVLIGSWVKFLTAAFIVACEKVTLSHDELKHQWLKRLS